MGPVPYAPHASSLKETISVIMLNVRKAKQRRATDQMQKSNYYQGILLYARGISSRRVFLFFLASDENESVSKILQSRTMRI